MTWKSVNSHWDIKYVYLTLTTVNKQISERPRSVSRKSTITRLEKAENIDAYMYLIELKRYDWQYLIIAL